MLKKVLSLLTLLLFNTTLFAQKVKTIKPKQKSNTQKKITPSYPSDINFRVGILSGTRVPAADFKIQKEITVGKGFIFVSCTVFFAGTGFPSVLVRSLEGNTLSQIQLEIDNCRPGSSITFSNTKIKGPDGIRTIDDLTYFLY